MIKFIKLLKKKNESALKIQKCFKSNIKLSGNSFLIRNLLYSTS